jgi:hypothetical protein
MKRLTLALMLTCNLCAAQVCDSLTTQTRDRVSGDTITISNKPIALTDNAGKTGIAITCLKYEGNVILSFKVVGAGSCISEADKINFVLADSSRLEIKNDHKFNCQGAMKLYFGGPFGKAEQLQKLLSSNVVTIRAWVGNNFIQKELTKKQAEQLRDTIRCLSSK